jgi:hypothetical protein
MWFDDWKIRHGDTILAKIEDRDGEETAVAEAEAPADF